MKPNRCYTAPFSESPTEQLRKSLPSGDGNWEYAETVYRRLASIANQMGRSSAHLSDLHIKTMAVMGTGHEETMKGHLMLLTSAYGWQWEEEPAANKAEAA